MLFNEFFTEKHSAITRKMRMRVNMVPYSDSQLKEHVILLLHLLRFYLRLLVQLSGVAFTEHPKK